MTATSPALDDTLDIDFFFAEVTWATPNEEKVQVLIWDDSAFYQHCTDMAPM